jgi:hypothetical protein
MRIERNPPSLVIVPTASASARSRSFGALLHEPERLTPQHAQSLLASAWTAVVGQTPSRQTAALLTAHWALETDTGRAMPGHNFAGIKAAASAAGALYRTLEGHGAARRAVNARFRVYASAEAGAHDYVRLLATRYPAALEAARIGDTTDFARALAVGGYFTGDPAAYSAGLRQRREALAQDSSASSANPAPPPPGTLAEVALAGVLHAFRSSEGES